MKWHGSAKCVIIKSRARLIPKKKEPKIEIIFLAISLSFVRLVKVVQNRVWTTVLQVILPV